MIFSCVAADELPCRFREPARSNRDDGIAVPFLQVCQIGPTNTGQKCSVGSSVDLSSWARLGLEAFLAVSSNQKNKEFFFGTFDIIATSFGTVCPQSQDCHCSAYSFNPNSEVTRYAKVFVADHQRFYRCDFIVGCPRHSSRSNGSKRTDGEPNR